MPRPRRSRSPSETGDVFFFFFAGEKQGMLQGRCPRLPTCREREALRPVALLPSLPVVEMATPFWTLSIAPSGTTWSASSGRTRFLFPCPSSRCGLGTPPRKKPRSKTAREEIVYLCDRSSSRTPLRPLSPPCCAVPCRGRR